MRQLEHLNRVKTGMWLMSSKNSSTNDASKPDSKRSGRLKLLAVAAVVYSLWMIWLLYVGIVNSQAGNQ